MKIFMFLFIFLSCYKSLAQDGLNEAALKAADDTPSVCVKSEEVKLPNGETLMNYAKKRGLPLPPESPRFKIKSIKELEAVSLAGDDVSRRRNISGPANLRNAPKGKIVFSFKNGHTVLLLAQKGEWFLVRGYYDQPCHTGWTHQTNLQPFVEP